MEWIISKDSNLGHHFNQKTKKKDSNLNKKNQDWC